MKTSLETHSHPMKWVFAIMIFVLMLTVTFDDAYGIWLPKSDGSGSGSGSGTPTVQQDRPITSIDTKCPPPPPEVPEPGTLILMGSGLAALHLWRKKRQVK